MPIFPQRWRVPVRHRHSPTAALCLGMILLVDVLRVWLPSIITIFGQAAATPAELMGAFALLWFLLALAAPPLVRLTGARPLLLVAAVALAGSRLALTATPGGQVQLYLACAGLLAGLVWLVGTAAGTDRPLTGVVTGLALGAAGHSVLDTYDLVWRGNWAAWLGSGLLVVLFLLAVSGSTPQPAGPGGARLWLLLGPTALLAGMVALSPALAATTVSYLFGDGPVARSGGVADLPQALLAATAIGLFTLTSLARPAGRWSALRRWGGPILLIGGAVCFALGAVPALVPAILLTATGLGACLAQVATAVDTAPEAAPANGEGPDHGVAPGNGALGATGVGATGVGAARRGYAVVGGMLVFAVGAVGYYAAYDIGYPNGAVPVVVALLIAALALRTPGGSTPTEPARVTAPRLPVVRIAVGLTVLVVAAAPLGRLEPDVPGSGSEISGPVRLVAYNVRMGFGMDGRFDLDGLVDVLRRQRPDVVLLSEVDRAWLLNGGHDTLALLARRLDMPYLFAPAADPVWGDAVLTRAPVRSARSQRLTALGAPTGAQALAVTLDLGGRELVVVSTHLQPPPGEGPVAQAGEVAEFATRYAAGRPLVVAGDLNTEPGDPAFAEFTGVGLVDALAAGRPLFTSPADAPDEEIDHVLVSAGIVADAVAAPASTASDHLPVAVTLTLP